MKLEKNTTISHYKILSEIGKGGMGEVYLAQDTELDRKIAIKFLSDEFSKDSEKLNRFIQEAKAASALNHPNILTVYEIGTTEDTRYIATEFIEGETIRDLLGKKDSIPLNKVLKVGIQVAEALSAAHQAGIIHRDIKPENIMIRKDGYVKVLDFGLAKLTETKEKDKISLEGETKALVKTNPGVVMGTVSYMSPEQAQGQETDARTDVWSLGVVLYELLAGRVPFEGKTINHTIVSILETEPKLLENVPDELQRIVRKTLTKEKENRYQTARDLLIDLKNLKRDLDIQGELERSIVPNKEEVTEKVGENETQVYNAKSIEETKAESGGLQTQNETKVTNASSLEYAVKQAKSNKFASAIVGIILLSILSAIAYFAFFSISSDAIDSIAVMPFTNGSDDQDVEYLSDGMTETLISSLSNIPNLSVKARSSVFRYKGKEVTPKKIGEELNVKAVLLGRVVKRDQDLTLNLELVDARTETVLWAEKFNRKMKDLVSLQSEIAKDVSNKLRLKLTTADQEKVIKTHTANSEANQFYLKGRFHWNKRNPKDFEKAAEFFTQAIEKDPNYGLAYTGLADTYALMPLYSSAKPKEYLPQAKKAALKAIELDDNLAEAHASIGQILQYFDYDFENAAREYKRAIELNPNYPDAHQWYDELLGASGRHDEGIAEIKKALKLDPLSLIANRQLGMNLMWARRYDEAITQLKKTLELDPNFAPVFHPLSDSYVAKGMYSEMVQNTLTAGKIVGMEPEWMEKLKDAFEKGGWKKFQQVNLEYGLLEKKNVQYPTGVLAYFYAGVKDKDKTMEHLNKAFEERSPLINPIKVHSLFDFLRDDPRFKELIKKIGFPE